MINLALMLIILVTVISVINVTLMVNLNIHWAEPFSGLRQGKTKKVKVRVCLGISPLVLAQGKVK